MDAQPETEKQPSTPSKSIDIKKSNVDEHEIEFPKDFEPGGSKGTIIVAAESYEEEDDPSDSEFNLADLQRRQSNIIEIEKAVAGELAKGEAIVGISDETKVDTVSDDLSVDNLDIEDGSEEDYNSPEWREKEKHVFVLSEAGKPIYTRHGSEDKLVTIMGVMQAIVSFVQGEGDSIRSIRAGGHKFVFLVRMPLILVSVACTQASVPQLVVQLTYVYNQILSVLTLTQLIRIFEQRRNYDLRKLLGGSERFMDSLVDTMDSDPSFLLSAVRCLPLESSVRENIGQAMAQQCSKVKNLVFSIMVAENQLVALVGMKKYSIHAADLHLIINLVNSSESFKAAESWTPICLPKFDSSGFLHAHISYLDEECKVCLLLLTVDRDMFFQLQECRKKIIEKLDKYQSLDHIHKALFKNGYDVSEVGVLELRHFLYKSRSAAQFTSPIRDIPYLEERGWKHLYGLYQYLHHRMYNGSRPLKMLQYTGQKETLLGWHMSGFELYAAFEPLVTKIDATNAMKKIIHWIKKEEDCLFIMNSPTI